MKKQSGFTLIELVVVIVILGILAATAAPKFMDLQTDARISAANGMAGAVKSAVSMTYSKAILGGKDKLATGNANAYVCASGTTCSTAAEAANKITLAYGRPEAAATGILNSLSETIEVESDASTADWNYVALVTDAPKSIAIYQKGVTAVTGTAAANFKGCGIVYTEPENSTTNPTVTVVTTDC
jgi:MSHA pilin protein MshA